MAATGAKDHALLRWPPRSPDLTKRYAFFFLRGYVKHSVFLPSLPRDLPELRIRIIATISEIDNGHAATDMGGSGLGA